MIFVVALIKVAVEKALYLYYTSLFILLINLLYSEFIRCYSQVFRFFGYKLFIVEIYCHMFTNIKQALHRCTSISSQYTNWNYWTRLHGFLSVAERNRVRHPHLPCGIECEYVYSTMWACAVHFTVHNRRFMISDGGCVRPRAIWQFK